jgi:hypothetical protein
MNCAKRESNASSVSKAKPEEGGSFNAVPVFASRC